MINKMPALLAAAFTAAGALTFIGCSKHDHSTHDHGASSAGAAKAYPLQTCVVSGEKLGSMGEPVVFIHEGQEVKLCCKNCRPDFDKEPAKYVKKIAAAQKN